MTANTSIGRRRAILLNEGATNIMTRLIDCVPFTKIINIPANASGTSVSGYVVSGGILVELDDALNSNAWTPNHVEVMFVPVSASLFDTNIDGSGYSFTGYGWVHPWDSNLQASSSYRGLHPDATIESGSGAYGWVAPLGIPVKIDVSADSNLKKIRLFNRFGGDVVAYINYTFQKLATQTAVTETISCGD